VLFSLARKLNINEGFSVFLSTPTNQKNIYEGWRDENYEVMSVTNVSLMEMDRSATCLFGIRNFGVEINGYIKHPQKGLCIWLQQRSSKLEKVILRTLNLLRTFRHKANMAKQMG
jgi:Domain of unknown function (DUF4743)